MIASVSDVSEPVIAVTALTRHFGAKAALDDVSITVPRGIVFGLVGANGAGKTTLIKHVLGLFKAQSGSVRVFGLDPVAEPARVLRRIGYVSEEHDLPGWMRSLGTPALPPGVLPELGSGLCGGPAPPLRSRPRRQGQGAFQGPAHRAGLLVALAHRPELLVLDEPSSGLDPIVRRDILEAIIRAIADEGRTVLFSSHLLHEVERVCDHVTMIDHGKIVFSAPLDDIKKTHRCLTLRFTEARSGPPALAGALAWEGTGHEWIAVCHGHAGELQAAAARCGAQVLDQRVPSLDEIFVARVGTRLPPAAED